MPFNSFGSSESKPKFSYDNYMRDLTEKVNKTSNVATLGASVPTGPDFQAFLLREREQFTRSVNDLKNEQVIIHSLVGATNVKAPVEMYSAHKLRSNESVGSLQYMSNMSD